VLFLYASWLLLSSLTYSKKHLVQAALPNFGKCSVPRGDRGCMMRISVVFLTPASHVYGSKELKAKAVVRYVVRSHMKPR